MATVITSGLTTGVAASTTTPTPVYSPPPREVSPFTPRDSFCSPTDNGFVGVKPNDPRLATKLTVVMLVPPATPPAPAANPGLILGNTTEEAQTFANLVDKCGGIGGRKLDFHVLTETADPTADCITATQVLHALVVISLGATPSQSCIVNDQHTILITESDVSNADLAPAQGRLAATGSTEGILQARILDLIDSGRLNGKRVAVVTGTSPADVEFAQLATDLLRQDKIEPTTADRADVLLMAELDPTRLTALTQNNASRLHQPALQVYGFSDTTDQEIDQLRQLGAAASAQIVQTLGVFSYTPIENQEGRLEQPAGTFATMCNKAYAMDHGKGVTIGGIPQPSPPAASDVPYRDVARVCLAMRIVARALFNAGIDVNQSALVKALHKLPNIENVYPDDSKVPRPNQVVNEPVSRVEQVVVLSQAEYPCQHPASQKVGVDDRVCWAPVSGWDSGGRVVNAPLIVPASAPPSSVPATG